MAWRKKTWKSCGLFRSIPFGELSSQNFIGLEIIGNVYQDTEGVMSQFVQIFGSKKKKPTKLDFTI